MAIPESKASSEDQIFLDAQEKKVFQLPTEDRNGIPQLAYVDENGEFIIWVFNEQTGEYEREHPVLNIK